MPDEHDSRTGTSHAVEPQRGRTAFGTWTAYRKPVPPRLAPFVTGSLSGWEEWADHPFSRREVPGLFLPLIFGFAAPFEIGWTDGRRDRMRSFIAGPSSAAALVTMSRHNCCVQANLTFEGAWRLFGGNLAALTDAVLSPREVLGRSGDELEDRLANLRSWDARLAALETFLEHHLLAAPPIPASIAHTLARTADHQRFSTRATAQALDMTPKRLIAEFRAHVGLTPKRVARLARFTQALRALEQGVSSLAGLAVDCGFTDQAHFTRDFGELAGVSPLRYRAELLALSGSGSD